MKIMKISMVLLTVNWAFLLSITQLVDAQTPTDFWEQQRQNQRYEIDNARLRRSLWPTHSRTTGSTLDLCGLRRLQHQNPQAAYWQGPSHQWQTKARDETLPIVLGLRRTRTRKPRSRRAWCL